MYDWQSFKNGFHSNPSLAPDRKQTEATLRHRDELGGTLFFDRIWTSLNLKHPTKSYPPKTSADQRNLLKTIIDAPVQDELKVALLYYVMRDTRNSALEASFLIGTKLPEKYRLMVTGLWEMDHLQFQRALEYLTDPSLTATFADEILLVLLTHPKSDPSLAMGYYISVRPPLQKKETLDAYFEWLVNTNVIEAYKFAKQRPSEHRRLFEFLVVAVHEEQADEMRAQRALQIVGLPLSEEEETWFEECLLQGQGSKCPGAKDSVLMRRLAMGKGLQAGGGSVNRLKGAKINGINWENIRNIMAG